MVWKWLPGLMLLFLLAGCKAADSLPPTVVPVTDSTGGQLAEQAGPVWVLLSGVDEHGLLLAHEVDLLADPRPDAPVVAKVHTGAPAGVYEIRHSGPQNLHRFYRVRTVEGVEGWVSDFFVRRQGYVYDGAGSDVPLFDTPGGSEVARLVNVSPVIIRNPRENEEWWLVETPDGSVKGWVEAVLVKESSEREFLNNGGLGHEH